MRSSEVVVVAEFAVCSEVVSTVARAGGDEVATAQREQELGTMLA